MEIKRISEYDIDPDLKNKLQGLLVDSFGEDYPSDRIYYKQLPHFRFVVIDAGNEIIGQVGLDYRVMNLNGKSIRVIGIIDLCVSKASESKGIGSSILSELNKFCKDKDIDYILLFADNPKLYLNNGFLSVKNKCKWLKINDEDGSTYGIGHEIIKELMIKEVKGKEWEEGELDLLGYLY